MQSGMPECIYEWGTENEVLTEARKWDMKWSSLKNLYDHAFRLQDSPLVNIKTHLILDRID